MAARHDRLGLDLGDRVAFVSHNSARLMTAFFGVCGFGRVLVPVNFRLSFEEVQYIVEHSGAKVRVRRSRAQGRAGRARGRARLRDRRGRRPLPRRGRAPPLGARRERHRDHQLHLRHDRAPQGRADHPPQHLDQRGHLRAAHGSDRPRRLPPHAADVPCQRMGDAVRDDRLRCATGGAPQGRRRRDPAPRRAVRRHRDVCGAGRRRRRARCRPDWEGEIPGRGRTRIIVAGAPPPTKTVARVESELGWEFIQIYGLTETSPLLTVNRSRQEWDDLTPEQRAQKLVRAGDPGDRRQPEDRRRRRGAGALQRRARGLLGAAGGVRAGAAPAAGSTPATAVRSTTTATSPSRTARRTSSSPAARTSPRSRSRTRSSATPTSPRWP